MARASQVKVACWWLVACGARRDGQRARGLHWNARQPRNAAERNFLRSFTHSRTREAFIGSTMLNLRSRLQGATRKGHTSLQVAATRPARKHGLSISAAFARASVAARKQDLSRGRAVRCQATQAVGTQAVAKIGTSFFSSDSPVVVLGKKATKRQGSKAGWQQSTRIHTDRWPIDVQVDRCPIACGPCDTDAPQAPRVRTQRSSVRLCWMAD